MDNSDCAATCLRIVSNYYGKNYTLQFLRDLCSTARFGASLKDLSKAAEHIGFKTLAFKTTNSYLKSEKPFPIILFWRQNHFVVLYNVDNNDNYFIADPSIGKIRLQSEAFNEHWRGEDSKGIALLLEPSTEFYAKSSSVQRGNKWLIDKIQFIKSIFNEHNSAFIVFLIIIVISSILTLSIPIVTKHLFDEGIANESPNRFFSFIFYLALFSIGELFSYFLLALFSIRISSITSSATINAFLTKLVRLPLSYFDGKTQEDFYQRMDDQKSINDFLSERLPQIIASIILITVSFAQLSFFHLPSSLLFVLIYALAIAWTFIFNKKIIALNYDKFNLVLKYRNTVTELFQGMYDLKLFSAHNKKVDAWRKLKKQVDSVDKSTFKNTNLQYIGVSTFGKLGFIITTLMCGLLVISNKMSLGTMLAIGFIAGQLSSPVEQIMQAIRQGQYAILAFDRMYEIQEKQNEDDDTKIPPPLDWQTILLKNISFKYPGSDNCIIKDVNLTILRNKITAIVGDTGCGKSTLIKLLLGIYTPDNGTIHVDDINLNRLDLGKWREQCGVVMQDGYIFSESIKANIALSEVIVNENSLYLSASVACIDKFVETLPQKYLSKIGKSGLELSGGQKQKILIARAVYKNPKTLFLDEATSSLDASTEKKISINLMNHFKDRTIIVAAHRLSTIKNADQIIVMRDGLIIESGTHDFLINKMGCYYELVSSQIF